MQTSNDDDDDGAGGSYEKPDLDCIIGASLIDDLGANSAVWDRIIRIYRSWHYSRANDSPVGLGQDICAVKMARQKTKPTIRMPAM